MDSSREPGHVFISYVREDAAEVDRLEEALKAADFRVWRDINELWPGEDWKIEIRKAITNGSLAFLACFSSNSQAKPSTYQREEIILGTEQMRLREPGTIWLIPIRFGECSIPSYDLGVSRDLNSLQRIDLFGDKREPNIARLIKAVTRILHQGDATRPGAPPASSPPETISTVSRLKAALHDPSRQIELADLVMDTATDVRTVLENVAEFPLSFGQPSTELERVSTIITTAHKYEKTVEPLLELLATGCAWGTSEHGGLWQRAIQSVGSEATKVLGGSTALLHQRRYPLTLALYAGGLGAVHRKNFESLRAIATDAKLKIGNRRTSAISEASPWRIFDDPMPQLLAQEAQGTSLDETVAMYPNTIQRYLTPISDYVAATLRPIFAKLLPHDDEYFETFDLLEVYLSLIAEDAMSIAPTDNVFRNGAWFGSFTWRTLHPGLENELYDGFKQSGSSWPPLQAGLFGGSSNRVENAFAILLPRAREARTRSL